MNHPILWHLQVSLPNLAETIHNPKASTLYSLMSQSHVYTDIRVISMVEEYT